MSEFTLATWGNIAEIIGAGSIVTGLITVLLRRANPIRFFSRGK